MVSSLVSPLLSSDYFHSIIVPPGACGGASCNGKRKRVSVATGQWRTDAQLPRGTASALAAHCVPSVPPDRVCCGTWGKHCERAHTGLRLYQGRRWKMAVSNTPKRLLQCTDAVRKEGKQVKLWHLLLCSLGYAVFELTSVLSLVLEFHQAERGDVQHTLQKLKYFI